MGTFVTQPTTPDLFLTKVPAPGAVIPLGLTAANVVQAADMNALEAAALDCREAIRGEAYNVRHFGAVGDGLADDTAAIVAAEAAAFVGGGELYFPTGNFRTSTGITLRVPVRSSSAAALSTTYTGGAAVQVGDGTNYLQRSVVELPRIVQLSRVWAAGSPGADVGVLLTSVQSCTISFRHVINFSTGVKAIGGVTSGAGRGFAYNKLFVGHLDNCLVCLDLSPTPNSWVNENQFVGGRLSTNTEEGVNIAGCRRVRLRKDPASGFSGPNNNIFVGCSLEGDGPQQHMELSEVSSNRFMQFRWEVGTGSPKLLLDGADCRRNVIDGGFASNNLATTLTNAPGINTIIRDGGIHTYEGTNGDAAAALLELRNANSINSGVFQVLDPSVTGLNPAARAATDYVVRMTGANTSFKQNADPFPRLRLSHTNGQIQFSNGTVDPVVTVSGTATSLVFGGTGFGAVLFSTDNAADIGQAATFRPRDVNVGRHAVIGGNLDHNGTAVGFYGTNPAAKPTVTGSRGGNAALASLLTALASLGLITDSSTA